MADGVTFYYRFRSRQSLRLLGLAVVVTASVIPQGCGQDHVKPGTVITNSVGMKLTSIPAGKFLMGNAVSDDWLQYEGPQHRVRITRPFHLGVHEVTRKEWTEVMGTTPWKGLAGVKERDRYPATYVNWDDATAFCRKLTEKERAAGRLKVGESYRLPTEAEWEYACRAGSLTRYQFGDGEGSLGECAWYHANTKLVGEAYAHEVGLKRANDWGLFDMHGNAWEWCADRSGEHYYRESPVADPQGPSEGLFRVVRGGSWFAFASFCRSAYRFFAAQEIRFYRTGFRVALGSGPSK